MSAEVEMSALAMNLAELRRLAGGALVDHLMRAIAEALLDTAAA